jgi:hypothetical protein
LLCLAAVGCGSPETALPPAAERAPRVSTAGKREPPALAGAAIVWRRWSAAPPGELIGIDLGGVVAGPAGPGPAHLERKLFPSRRRIHELASFARLYAPFSERGPEGVLEFRGGGRLPADDIVRRMVREWARLAAAEAAAGATDEVYGVALLWQRSGPGATPCDELAVSLSGGAWAVACAGGVERRFAAQLTPARMRQVYGWIDALAPLQSAGAAVEPEGRPTRLVLAGAGAELAGDAVRREIAAFAEALHAELQAAPRVAFRAPEPPPPAYPGRPPPRPYQRRPAGAAAPSVSPAPPAPPVTEPGEPAAVIEIRPATTEPPHRR